MSSGRVATRVEAGTGSRHALCDVSGTPDRWAPTMTMTASYLSHCRSGGVDRPRAIDPEQLRALQRGRVSLGDRAAAESALLRAREAQNGAALGREATSGDAAWFEAPSGSVELSLQADVARLAGSMKIISGQVYLHSEDVPRWLDAQSTWSDAVRSTHAIELVALAVRLIREAGEAARPAADQLVFLGSAMLEARWGSSSAAGARGSGQSRLWRTP